MARTEKVIMTNMCMVFSENRVLVQDKTDDDYSGITFPGGHVERGESFTDAVIREVWEETGLKISEPKLCGIKDWMKDEETRYIVLLYKTDKFEGIVTSSEEGDVFWLYVGKFAEGISEEASTKEGKLSPTTKSIKGSFYERSIDNLYEVSVDESNLVAEDTDAATAIKDWFSKVQEAPDAAA